MLETSYLTLEELNNGLETIQKSPKDKGTLELIVRRPEIDVREVLEIGELNINEGLVGDNWKTRGSSRTKDGLSHPDRIKPAASYRALARVDRRVSLWL